MLRGPQGTLYGASSLGGLLKYSTLDPSLTSVSGQVQAGTEDVYNGGNLGYSFRGAINVPLDDTLAIRASTFYRADPGYIDDVLTGQTHVDQAWVDGGFCEGAVAAFRDFLTQSHRTRAALLVRWNIPEAYSGLGDLQQSAVWGSGAHSHDTQAYSATLTAKLGSVDLTAVSGYSIRRFAEWEDYTSIFGSYTLAQFGVTGTPVVATGTTYRFTQEIRLHRLNRPEARMAVRGLL